MSSLTRAETMLGIPTDLSWLTYTESVRDIPVQSPDKDVPINIGSCDIHMTIRLPNGADGYFR